MATKKAGRARAPAKTTRARSRRSLRAAAGDAIKVLAQDHKRVQQLFRQFERTSGDDARAHEIAERTCRELEIHAQLEEQIFYPAVHGKIKEPELIDEAEVEHQSAKDLIQQVRQLRPQDPKFAATVRVLSEYVQHHVREEERKIFPQVKRAKVDTAHLAEQMHARREQLMGGEGVTTAEAMEGALAGAGRRGNGAREGART